MASFLRITLKLFISVTFVASLGATPARAGEASQYVALYARPSSIPHPSDNPYTKPKAELGRMLFFDPRLSGSNWISCASCHNPAFSWGDGLAKGVGNGMATLGRRTPTILDLAWGELMFWDGRAGSLEEQALGPVQSTAEMNQSIGAMLEKLKSIPGYKLWFSRVFPGQEISADNVAKAIAAFERTVVSAEAPFDRWIKGDKHAISVEAQRGFVLFNEKAACAKCHSGWRFTDDSFYDVGLADDDLGRGKILATIGSMQHAFKTPTLRNVSRRFPYMHDGSEASLTDVIRFYNEGGRAKRPSVSEHVRPLGLTEREMAELRTFLETLTSHDALVTIPELPR